MNKMQKYFFITFGCSFSGYIICKYSFLPICKLLANFFGCDYAVIALGLYLLIFVVIGCVLRSVRTDITTETYYKNNFTPTKALMLAAVLIFFHINLIRDTTRLDKEGKILNLYNTIINTQIENKKEKKNETNIEAKNNNSSTNDDTNGMRYRD